MFGNYFKIAYRNLTGHKLYTSINLFGLAVGIAATILIMLYIQFEFSYDNFHENAGSIYRVSIVQTKEGVKEFDGHVFTPPMGSAMYRDFPEVENYVRFSTPRTAYFQYEGRAYKIRNICYVDSTLFDVFSFELLAGNEKKVLAAPYSLVLTENTAGLIFGSDNPIGKVLTSNGKSYEISGVIKSPPSNSHIQFNALISFSTLYENPDLYLDWNGGNQYISYVKLHDGVDPAAVEAKFPDFMWGYINKQLSDVGVKYEPYLQPLRDIHLQYSGDTNSALYNIYIFSAIAFLILLMACINFINLATALAGKRAREVGIRKAMGAGKAGLIRQFIAESILLAAIGSGIALILVELLFPFYSELVNYNLNVFRFSDPTHIVGLIVIIVIVGIGAGSYPAFYMSSFPPARILQGTAKHGKDRLFSRNLLVILQFVISITLIICTILINSQLKYMKNKALGFEKENMVIIPLTSDELRQQSKTIKKEISDLPGVLDVTASSEVPINGFTSNGYFPEGFKTPMMIHVVDIDKDFLNTYGINVIEGRNFSDRFATDNKSYLVNEKLVKTLGWNDPVGKTIRRNGWHKIIGVVSDFNFANLYNSVEPLILTNEPGQNGYNVLTVKIDGQSISSVLSSMKQVWEKFAPALPFEYGFLDEAFNNLYWQEQQFQTIVLYFSCLAIIIAGLGLFSLASFATERRHKEIGIRKVMGASVPGIIRLITREFILLIVIANIIAWPIAYFVMKRWLENFAYRASVSWEIFVIAGAVAMLTALITISYQAIRAALSNPVDAIKYE